MCLSAGQSYVFIFILNTSKHGCGAMLAQEKDGILRPVRSFTSAESRWTTMQMHLVILFAEKWGLEQFRSYIQVPISQQEV